MSPQFHGPTTDSITGGDRPPRYVATLRSFEMAVREAIAMHPDLHDLIGLQSIDAAMRAFVRTAAPHEPPEVVLRRVKGVLRGYERHHHVEHEELVRRAIVAYYGNADC